MARASRIRNGLFDSNTYVCPTSEPGACLVIDPGLDAAAIEAALAAAALRPVAVVCTHGHFDHVGSAAVLQQRFDIPVYLHRADERTARTSNFLMMAFKIDGRVTLPRFELVGESGVLRFGDDELRWIHAPGHTPGSSVLLFGGNAFTGDTIYRDGVGLVELPGEDRAALRASIAGLWTEIPDDVLVNPGHGGAAAFGDVKQNNASLRQFLGMGGQA